MNVDWSKFDHPPTSTAYCKCDAVWRTNGKMVAIDPPAIGFKIVTETPCPSCGRSEDHVRRLSYEPETMVLRVGDVNDVPL